MLRTANCRSSRKYFPRAACGLLFFVGFFVTDIGLAMVGSLIKVSPKKKLFMIPPVLAVFIGSRRNTIPDRDWGANVDQLHALAPPFAGRWYTKPIDPAIALELMARQFEARLEEDSLFYLEAAMWKSAGGPKGVLGEELVQKHYAFARRYKAEVKSERAAAHFERSPLPGCITTMGRCSPATGNLSKQKLCLKKRSSSNQI